MTVTRTMDATFLNRVANDPDVRPFIGGDGVLDFTGFCANPENYALITEGGGWILNPLLPGTYALHTLFLKAHRGKAYVRAAREAMRWMFSRTDCLELATKCPDDNPGAHMAATMAGFRERFHRDDAWEPGVGISYQVLTLDAWIARDPECLREGRAFHEALEAEKTARGSTLPAHPDDDAHDRHVGACALMIKGGMPEKGVAIYNRFAVFAGYSTVDLVGPNTLDVRDAIVAVEDGAMAVLLVRGVTPSE